MVVFTMYKKLDKKKLAVYLVIPFVLTTLLAVMYFSHIIVLQRLISPKLPPLLADSWREFGLLENIQNTFLLVMLVTLLAGIWRATERLQRAAFVFIMIFTLFVFLEEVDYGTHWYQYAVCEEGFDWFKPLPLADLMALKEVNDEAVSFNLHNQGEMTKVFKLVGDFSIIFLFVLIPLLAPYIKNRYVRYAAPERYAIFTAIMMLATSKIIHLIGKIDKHFFKEAVLSGNEPAWEVGSISSNLSEFRELNIYYLFAVYLIILVFYRSLQKSTSTEEEAAAGKV
ncbi:MAG: hypothetical protein KAH38_06760 [Candidatus Hydrogenedentes bacterium]|nr:hypothetical protein [Candidatus Hydrogenedentota bacterium]